MLHSQTYKQIFKLMNLQINAGFCNFGEVKEMEGTSLKIRRTGKYRGSQYGFVERLNVCLNV